MRVALTVLLFSAFCAAQQQPASTVTQLSAELGSCSADFHITDMAGNPLYNVKIETVIRHGFLSKRKLELEAGTNADGRARFVNLPEEAKKPITFRISNGVDRAIRTYDPSVDCHERYDIPMHTDPARSSMNAQNTDNTETENTEKGENKEATENAGASTE